MISVYGLNVNKFSADRTRRFFLRAHSEQPDFICLQETHRSLEAFPPFAILEGYHIADSFEPEAPGHNGVAILSKHPVSDQRLELCEHGECRGRFVEIVVGDLRVASAYAHAHRADDKSRWYMREQFNECLGRYIRRNASLLCILVMDANVALTRADVLTDTQWAGLWANGSSGRFRKPIANALKESGWADSYRVYHGDRRRSTVWYSEAAYLGEDKGFGIDFQLISPPLVNRLRYADVLRPEKWVDRFSDHAPTIGRYDLDLRNK